MVMESMVGRWHIMKISDDNGDNTYQKPVVVEIIYRDRWKFADFFIFQRPFHQLGVPPIDQGLGHCTTL